jgi:hypothetical protein
MWFMGFSAEDQMAMLTHLGVRVGRRGGWVLFMVLPSSFIAVLVLLGRLRKKTRRRPPEDEARRIYARFLDKMARAGCPKAPHQGPVDYARVLEERHPALKQDVRDIAGRYIGLRYGREGGVEALIALRKRVRRFKPRQAIAAGRREPQV